jgi:four helix bundle protein
VAAQNVTELMCRYEAHFISKLSDCDGENAETDTSQDFARDCGYISTAEHAELATLNREVDSMLGSIIKNPEKFLLGPRPGVCHLIPSA